MATKNRAVAKVAELTQAGLVVEIEFPQTALGDSLALFDLNSHQNQLSTSCSDSETCKGRG